MAKIDGLFKILKDKGGSDLHLSPGNPPLIRRSGDLEPVFDRPIGHEQNKAILYEIMTADQLGLPPAVLNFTQYKKGLVLVTGPTGSGKSTTLAAMIDHVNKTRKEHILTIEDPIEFVHVSQQSLINQREVGRHTLSFAAALKAALREDPNLILVGQMRDMETIELAITAAETGHLVFGTLHTNSAAKTVDRIINVFPTSQQEQIRTMLGESLRGG